MHNINTYIGRQAAWHSLGKVTRKYETTAELLADPGFQFEIVKEQLEFQGHPVNSWATFRWDFADRDANKTDAKQFLGNVGETYEVIQHAEGFAMIDSIMQSANSAHYETAGVLGAGERIWALADLGLAAKVGDDVQQGYLLFSTGHDGSMAHTYRICMTRVVCQNTLGRALSEKAKASLTVRHTKNALKRLEDSKLALEGISGDVFRIEDRLNFLAGRRCNRESVEKIFDRLFPKTEKNEKLVSSSRRNNIIADVLKLYELNDGNAFPEQRGTPYALLNAITNYTDHERGADDSRAESALFGSGDQLKARAFDVIYEIAGKSMQETPSRQYFVPRSEHDEAVAELLRQ